MPLHIMRYGLTALLVVTGVELHVVVDESVRWDGG
jgi:hypothetical protein